MQNVLFLSKSHLDQSILKIFFKSYPKKILLYCIENEDDWQEAPSASACHLILIESHFLEELDKKTYSSIFAAKANKVLLKSESETLPTNVEKNYQIDATYSKPFREEDLIEIIQNHLPRKNKTYKAG